MHYGIIAAGEGSRLVQEGVSLPKPLVEIAGKPMIGRLISIFKSCGAESINVIVNEEMKEVRQYLEQLAAESSIPLRIKVKSTPSSMHSFFELSSMMPENGKFVLTTVDTIFRPEDFEKYVKSFEEATDVDALMAVTSYIDDEKPLYVETDPEMHIKAFSDSALEDVKYISGGIYGLTTPSIGVLQKCLNEGISRMRNFQRQLLKAGLRVDAFDMGKILDVDHASDIEKANSFLGNS